MKPTLKILIYALYALTAGIVFLYLLFPSDLIKEVLVERLAQTQSGIQVRVETIRPTLAPGLSFQPLSISYADKAVLRSEQVKLRPHLLSLLGDPKIFSFNGPLGSGRFSGHAEMTRKQKRPQNTIHIDLTGVPLDAIELFKQWPHYLPYGEIEGQIAYDSLKGGSGTVEVNVVIAPARIVIDPPLMGLKVLEFSELRATLSATQRRLTIKRCEAFGAQLEGKITGSIAFDQPMGNSRPTLSLTVKPQAAFIADHKDDMIGGLLASDKAQKRGVVFQIAGTLDNPSYVVR
jgi:type II secretion system protein N